MSSLGEKLREATELLNPVTETPRLDAEILMAHALGTRRSKLLAMLGESLETSGFDEMVKRRLASEPIAYITGEWEFFSHDFIVEQPMLVPRPETEHLVEAVTEFNGAGRILEIGTGTGCISVSTALVLPECRIVATDINPAALDLAQRNASRHNVSDRIDFRSGSLFKPIAMDETFDVICSNPPYVEEDDWPDLSPVIRLYEDPGALLAGKDGLDIIRNLIIESMVFLRPGGLLAFEIGMGQYMSVEKLLKNEGYKDVSFINDLAGIERVVIGIK